MTRLFLIPSRAAALWAPALGLAALAMTAPLQAQSTGWIASTHAASSSYAGDARQSYHDSRRAAYDNGYQEGVKQGERDGRRGERFAYQDERTFQRADKGYHREFGDLDRYRQSFRTGFSAGYDDAYRRVTVRNGNGPRGPYESRGPNTYPNQNPGPFPGNRYPGPGAQSSGPAYQNGVNDGYEKGLEDARKRRSFDPLRHDWYRSGDRHFESRYGSRELYKDLYRDGFKTGYERGYRR